MSVLYRAILRSLLGRYSVYAVNLLSMMMLARLFTPQDFGTVAAIMVFFLFFQLMAEAGLGPAIINLKKLEVVDRDGLFGLTLFVGLVASLSFAALGPVFLSFYQLPKVDEVVPYVAFGLFFFTASIVPNALLLRDQFFFKIAAAGLIAEILSTAAAIFLSFLVDPLHALAAKGGVSALAMFIAVWCFSKGTDFGRPMLGGKFSAVKPLLGFSGYQFGFNFINYFSRNLDKVLIGRFMDAASLGVYEKSYQLMRYPLMLLSFAMTPAIQPVLRKYADSPAVVEEIHRDFVLKLSVMGIMAGVLMYSSADWVVWLLLGDKWMSASPIIRILAISIPAQVVLSTSGSFFQAMGRADALLMSGMLSAIIMVALIVFGVTQRNLELLCWCIVIAVHVNFIQAYWLLYKKVFKARLFGFFIRMIPLVLTAFGMAVFSI